MGIVGRVWGYCSCVCSVSWYVFREWCTYVIVLSLYAVEHTTVHMMHWPTYECTPLYIRTYCCCLWLCPLFAYPQLACTVCTYVHTLYVQYNALNTTYVSTYIHRTAKYGPFRNVLCRGTYAGCIVCRGGLFQGYVRMLVLRILRPKKLAALARWVRT